VLAALRDGRGSVRQRAGPGNALGRVKFLFPNEHDVYLHDTPVQAAFARERRDLSHGCVRVADPEALARWTLRGVPGWDDGRVTAAMAGAETMSVSLPRPIPVVFVYHTTVVEQDALRFLPDVYGHDAVLRRAMAGASEQTAAHENAVESREPRPAAAAEAAAL
jgi:murein L,D-transpeptidase YcbB/YkuD